MNTRYYRRGLIQVIPLWWLMMSCDAPNGSTQLKAVSPWHITCYHTESNSQGDVPRFGLSHICISMSNTKDVITNLRCLYMHPEHLGNGSSPEESSSRCDVEKKASSCLPIVRLLYGFYISSILEPPISSTEFLNQLFEDSAHLLETVNLHPFLLAV